MQLEPIQLCVAVTGSVHSFILYSHSSDRQKVPRVTVGYRNGTKNYLERRLWQKYSSQKTTWNTKAQLQMYYDHSYETTEICRENNKMEKFKYILQLTQELM